MVCFLSHADHECVLSFNFSLKLVLVVFFSNVNKLQACFS